MTVPAAVRAELVRAGSWRRPQAVIRFGYGPPVPLTPRRPITDVLLD